MTEFKKKGFTLIEVLIVVVIIGTLSMMAIGSYTRYRKASLAELAADGIVSSLYEARDEVRLGKVSGLDADGEVAPALCHGLKFSSVDGAVGVMEVSAEFDSQKKSSAGKWVSKGCNLDVIVDGAEVGGDDLVSVESVNGNDGGECSVLFAPPDGKVSGDCVGVDGLVEVVLSYGADADNSYKRKLSIDLNTGITEVKRIDE